MYSQSIQKLIKIFTKFPTIGPRTAARFVFYLLKLPKEEIDNLISVISQLKADVKICKLCFIPFQNESELCEICSSQRRNKNLLCLVEKEIDLNSIEKTKKYSGLYFILGGTISNLKKKDIEKLKIKELEQRIKTDLKIKEIIIATNSTTEGQSTALYLERLLQPFNKKITRLARGLPIGGELEYADEETLSSALENRRSIV